MSDMLEINLCWGLEWESRKNFMFKCADNYQLCSKKLHDNYKITTPEHNKNCFHYLEEKKSFKCSYMEADFMKSWNKKGQHDNSSQFWGRRGGGGRENKGK